MTKLFVAERLNNDAQLARQKSDEAGEVARLRAALRRISILDQWCGGNLTFQEMSDAAMREARAVLKEADAVQPPEKRKPLFFGFSDRLNMAEEFRQHVETLNTLTGVARYSGGPKVVITAAAGFPTDDEIIFADYSQGCYEGSAFVLYEKAGQLFEVNGSHCSCNGLEDQWSPEATTWAALAEREFYGMDEEPKRALKALIQANVGR